MWWWFCLSINLNQRNSPGITGRSKMTSSCHWTLTITLTQVNRPCFDKIIFWNEKMTFLCTKAHWAASSLNEGLWLTHAPNNKMPPTKPCPLSQTPLLALMWFWSHETPNFSFQFLFLCDFLAGTLNEFIDMVLSSFLVFHWFLLQASIVLTWTMKRQLFHFKCQKGFFWCGSLTSPAAIFQWCCCSLSQHHQQQTCNHECFCLFVMHQWKDTLFFLTSLQSRIISDKETMSANTIFGNHLIVPNNIFLFGVLKGTQQQEEQKHFWFSILRNFCHCCTKPMLHKEQPSWGQVKTVALSTTLHCWWTFVCGEACMNANARSPIWPADISDCKSRLVHSTENHHCVHWAVRWINRRCMSCSLLQTCLQVGTMQSNASLMPQVVHSRVDDRSSNKWQLWCHELPQHLMPLLHCIFPYTFHWCAPTLSDIQTTNPFQVFQSCLMKISYISRLHLPGFSVNMSPAELISSLWSNIRIKHSPLFQNVALNAPFRRSVNAPTS